MNGLALFDTNILVYADDASAPDKQTRAISLFAEHQRRGAAVISLQVLQEYFAAATRKLGLDPEFAQRKVELLARARVVRFQERDVHGSLPGGVPVVNPFLSASHTYPAFFKK